jgi:hypothetical protein
MAARSVCAASVCSTWLFGLRLYPAIPHKLACYDLLASNDSDSRGAFAPLAVRVGHYSHRIGR